MNRSDGGDTLDRERYWASETDPEVLIKGCMRRFDTYADTLDTTLLSERLRRQWRYYHNLYHGSVDDGMEIKELGEKGELAGLSINHFRNFIQHVISMVTEARIEFDPQARNADQASLDATRKAKALVDDYRDNGTVHKSMLRALEHALVLLEGYIWCVWDDTKGERLAIDEDETGQPTGYIHEGDVVTKNPTIFDVARDVHVREFERNQWFVIRDYINRHDAAAQWPEKREEILAEEVSYSHDSWRFDAMGIRYDDTDQISIYTMLHEPSPALPNGKYFRFIGDAALDEGDRPLETTKTGLFRMVPSEMLLTSMGYSPAIDLQGPAEAYNGETSAILTNHKTFGVQNIWTMEGDTVKERELSGGLHHISSRTKPEPLNLTQTPGEMFKFRSDLLIDMGQLIGVNQTRRGFPEKSVHSGTALALLDAQSQQFNTPISEAWITLYEQVMTEHVRLVDVFMAEGHSRDVAVTGKNRKASRVQLKKGSLELVDRVRVKRGNALSRTTAGRVELAQMLISNGLVKMPEELLNVIETGQIDTLVEGERAQLEIVHDENETMTQGQPVVAMFTDNQVLHIREHAALLNSTEVRMDQNKASFVLAHIMEHMQLMMNPMGQILQMTLGYAPQGPVSPGGVPGGDGEEFDEENQDGGQEMPAGVQAPRKPKVERPALGAA